MQSKILFLVSFPFRSVI